MAISAFDRFKYDAFNLGYALIGPATNIFLIWLVVMLRNQYAYMLFGAICLGYIIYYLYLYFTDAAKDSTETSIIGDSGPTNDSYLMSSGILVIYIAICIYEYMNLKSNSGPSRLHNSAHSIHRRVAPTVARGGRR